MAALMSQGLNLPFCKAPKIACKKAAFIAKNNAKLLPC